MTVSPVFSAASASSPLLHYGPGLASATWASIPNGEASAAAVLANYALASAQVSGTFGAAGSIQLEGSNDGVTWAILKDINGTQAIWTAGAKTVYLFYDGPIYIRPNCTGGDGTTSFTMVVSARKQALN